MSFFNMEFAFQKHPTMTTKMTTITIESHWPLTAVSPLFQMILGTWLLLVHLGLGKTLVPVRPCYVAPFGLAWGLTLLCP